MSKMIPILAAVALLISAGCASMAADSERSLAGAGFQMKFAKTPAQIAKANAFPQRRLTPTPGPDGGNFFVYADMQYCKCVYVGTEAAYDRYQKIAISRRIAENEAAGSMDDWGAWGAWGPWY
jgi:hypothetical protein